ncbi:hypothetical protein KKD72_02125 [Patescibacteria group bacterium]|nr:hypothetical protein [Patescibacteria group bacterium]
MKRFASAILISFVFLSAFNFSLAEVFAQPTNSAKVYFFYGETCPHCKKEKAFLEELKPKYPGLEIVSYEVFDNRENAKLFQEFLAACGENVAIRVPATFIGNEVIIGYTDDATTGKRIENAINACLGNQCPDPLDKIDGCEFCQCQEGKECLCQECDCPAGQNGEIIDYPLIGEINLSRLSLPVLTIAVAALDGFNPCAMWVLLFLIALLINVRSRKKMWLVGGVFIAASGIVYYLLLSAWLNLFLALGYVSLTRVVIGVLAIGVGVWQLKKFITYRPGVCEIAPVGGKLNQSLTQRAKQVVQSTTLPATLLGVVVLALGVNLVEFFCSAGLPAIYTRILSLSQLNPLSYYLYLLLYTFVFMLDDLIIFIIAAVTLSKIGFTDKYSKWATLTGGLVILILGFLLIFRPDFLMFG